jgi:hypothetical protein
MSVVTVIRDYIEVLTNLSAPLLTNQSEVHFKDVFQVIPITEFLKETSLYFAKTLQLFFIYIFSFQWLRDFTVLPITIPQFSIYVLREQFFLENSSHLFFNFLEITNIQHNSFLLGLLNSFGLTLPISLVHLLTLRRLYIKGIPAACYSIGGYLAGQLLWIGCVIFGLRALIVPWFTFEPLNYIVGIALVLRIVYSMRQESLREMIGWQQPQYVSFFLTSFLLAWCEQSTICQYLGNLNFAATGSLLDIPGSQTGFTTFIQHFCYILGLSLGSIFCTILWGFAFIQIKNLIIEYTPLFLSRFMQRFNTGSFILAIALSLSTIPFYGLDYLFTKPLGFVAQDKVFKNTIFAQYNIHDVPSQLGINSRFEAVDFDISPFDRGRYLMFPEKDIPFAFEDLNYRGEADWISRHEKGPIMTDSRGRDMGLSNLFKKQKTDSQNRGLAESVFPIRSSWLGSTTQALQEQQFKDRTSETSIARVATLRNDAFATGSPELQARFDSWYSMDTDLQDSNAEKGLERVFIELQDTTFPDDFFRTDSTSPGNLDFRIKSKYYSNPVYKNLLALDIDLFLQRQPKEFRFNGQQELDVYTKRQVLTSYYNTLRDYARLPYTDDFETFFQGTKSFTNKVYNQQFKGTLRSVCRLFALTPDENAIHTANQAILKYDQPLYVFDSHSIFRPTHEEVTSLTNSVDGNSSPGGNSLPTQVNGSPNNQPEPFLDEIISGPVYAGWDESGRKFVITNKFLPRTVAGYRTILENDVIHKFQKGVRSTTLENESGTLTNSVDGNSSSADTQKDTRSRRAGYRIKFTVWPLHDETISTPNTAIPFTSLYTPKQEFGPATDHPILDTFTSLPSNWETRNRRIVYRDREYANIFDYLAPQRGGFIWPGKPTLLRTGSVSPMRS